MKKYLKGCLIVAGVLLLLFLLFAACIWWGWDSRRKQATKDGLEGSEICDTMKYITEQPELSFIGFRSHELRTLKFRILREGCFIEDTVIRTGFNKSSHDELLRLKIPYAQFLKTDTLVVTTDNQLQYYISGYHHYAYLHYGMFGYLGSYDCRFSDECIINNRAANGAIERINGWVNPEQAKLVTHILPGTDEYELFSNKYAVTIKAADSIFVANRQNKKHYSMYSYGIEVMPDSSYYIFGEEREDREGRIDIVKINMVTGTYRRYKNYPFDDAVK